MSFSTHFGVRGRRGIAVFSALSMLIALMPVFIVALPAQAIGDQPESAIANPNLSPSCGLDVLLVLDETGSMDDDETALENAYREFILALEDSGTRIGVVDFSSRNPNGNSNEADRVDDHPDDGDTDHSGTDLDFAIAGYHATSTANVSPGGILRNYVDASPDGYEPGGFTNWQEALWAADEFESTHGNADLVVFFTDGDPNTVDSATPGFAGTNGELDDSQTEMNTAAAWAVEYSNDLKDGGTHILGFGLGLGGANSTSRLSSVTGPHGATNAGEFDASTTDYVTFSGASDIATAFETLANQLCTSTINITKYIQNDPTDTFDAGTGVGSGFATDSGWGFGVSLGDNNGATWIDGPPGSTNGSGTVSFTYNLDNRDDTSDATITETLQSGWGFLGGNCVTTPLNGSPGAPQVFGNNGWTVQDIPDRATVDCDVYNQASFLTLDKHVVNNDGGQADDSDFTLTATGPVTENGSDGFSARLVPSGNYTLSESGPSGYTASAWSCENGALVGNTVTVAVGAHVLCEITNNDVEPTLTLEKVVDNSNGGDAVDTDFTLTATGPDTIEGVEGAGAVTNASVMGGTYTLSETGPDGYTQVGDWSCTNGGGAGDEVTLASGQDVTCTVTNASEPAELTLVKNVNNQFGTNEAATSWNLAANGPGSNDFNGNGTASQGNLPAGDYVLSESGPSGWTASGWSCPGASLNGNTVTLEIGDDVTCTITNTPNHPHLTLVKNLQLGQGANETEADFTLTADGPTFIQVPGANAQNATENDAFVGTYELSESGPAGYTQVGGWVCVGGDQDGDEITLAVDDDVVCTVTNASDPAQVTLVKQVNNNHGGDLGPADFQLTLNDSNVSQGANAVVPNMEYTVSELDVDGYSQVGEVVCADDSDQSPVAHPFSLDEGQEITCTITNEDEPGAITVVKRFSHPTNVDPDAFDLTITPDGEDAIEVLSGDMTELDGNETYSIGETLLEGWSQLSLVCEDGDDEVDHPVDLANGQHVTCVITNGETPSVTVVKVTDGEDEATFGFSGDLGDFSFDENGGSETFAVDPGEYQVTETAAEFWSLTDVSCSDGATGDLNSASGSFDVGYGDHQTCTFTNVQLPKTIEVIAEGVCDGPIPQLKWVVNPINFNGTSVDITWLDIDAGDPLYQQLAQPLQGVMTWPGIVVDEGNVVDWPGWIQVDGEWVQGADGYEGTIPTAKILFSIDPDLIVMVDYADCSEPPAEIIVEKQVEGESPQDFAFTFTATGFTLSDDTLAHGESASSGDLLAGDGYAISEAIPSGWEQVSAVCDDGSDPSNIELSAGETVTCTFTNNLPVEVEPIEVLPFTGLDSDVLVALAIVLAMTGGLALFLSRNRGRHEGLDR